MPIETVEKSIPPLKDRLIKTEKYTLLPPQLTGFEILGMALYVH